MVGCAILVYFPYAVQYAILLAAYKLSLAGLKYLYRVLVTASTTDAMCVKNIDIPQ